MAGDRVWWRAGRRTRGSPARLLALPVALLLAGGFPAAANAPGVAAASPRVESAWTGALGTSGANGTATVRAFDTENGSVVLALKRLVPSHGYAVAIHRGTCSTPGARLVSLGTLRTGPAGTLATTRPLTKAQVAAIRGYATGMHRISLRAGSGTAARCATLAKSRSVVPQVWFAPLPPMPIREGRPYIGSTDFADLFAPDAPWTTAAGRTHVFKLYGEWLGGTASDAELRRVVAALRARDIAIAIEAGPLIATTCGDGVEGFAGGAPETLRLIRRVVAAGGTVRYVAMDEPYFYGSLYDGPNACRWSAAKVAAEVARFVRAVKAAYPSIVIGDVEPLAGPATAARYQAWMAAARSAIGAPLAFFHLDMDWGRGDWPAASLQLQAYARGHGVRLGMIYNAPGIAPDQAWLEDAWSHVVTHELDGAGPPDDAVFQSWTDKPDRVLPEAGPNTFTHLIADYARTRTTIAIDPLELTAAGAVAASGELRTLGGSAVAGARIDLLATPRDGPFQVQGLSGTVPAGATHAVVGVRVNDEGAGPGTADMTFYEMGYGEGGGPNLVPNPRFDAGLDGWGWWGDGSLVALPSDRGSGQMVRLAATPTQHVDINSSAFAVTPGATYRASFAARIPESSAGSGYLAVIFLGPSTEVRRDPAPLAPAPLAVGSATTDSTGRFEVTSGALVAGGYRLQASFAGDATRWPARGSVEATVP